MKHSVQQKPWLNKSMTEYNAGTLEEEKKILLSNLSNLVKMSMHSCTEASWCAGSWNGPNYCTSPARNYGVGIHCKEVGTKRKKALLNFYWAWVRSHSEVCAQFYYHHFFRAGTE